MSVLLLASEPFAKHVKSSFYPVHITDFLKIFFFDNSNMSCHSSFGADSYSQTMWETQKEEEKKEEEEKNDNRIYSTCQWWVSISNGRNGMKFSDKGPLF